MKRLAALAVLLLAGCASEQASKTPAVPDMVRLSRADDVHVGGSDAALAAFRASCAVLMAKHDATPLGASYAGTVADWRGVCAKPAGADFFEKNFTPFAVEGDGLFTGYYAAEISASRTRHGKYQTPVYGLPPDLIRADLGAFIPKLKGEHISGKVQGGKLVPYADRAAINAAGVKAPVLFWADDPVAVFFLQIQGSGRVVLDDGTVANIAYAGENGRPYTAIGRTLIAQNELARENVSLQSIRAWLVAHPDRARSVMETNQSFVFFREGPGTGSQGVPLIAMGSMAVDLRLHALGVPMFVDADGPDPVKTILVAQDTGGAIRGPVRGDIFFGAGPDAEARAGAMKAPGRLYVLLPDALAARMP